MRYHLWHYNICTNANGARGFGSREACITESKAKGEPTSQPQRKCIHEAFELHLESNCIHDSSAFRVPPQHPRGNAKALELDQDNLEQRYVLISSC